MVLTSPLAGAAEGPWVAHPQVRSRLVAATNVAASGGEVELGVELELEPGWHAYWRNSGDAGFAPAFDWSATRGARVGDVEWPAPSRFSTSGGVGTLGYAGEVIYPLSASVTTEGTVHLVARVRQAVCSAECVLLDDRLALELPVGSPRPDPATAARIESYARTVPDSLARWDGWSVTSRLEESTLVVEVRAPERQRADAADLFFDSHPTLSPGPPRVEGDGDTLRFTVDLRPRMAGPPPPPVSLNATFTGLVIGGATKAATISIEATANPETEEPHR